MADTVAAVFPEPPDSDDECLFDDWSTIDALTESVFVVEEPDNASYDPTKLFRIATA